MFVKLSTDFSSMKTDNVRPKSQYFTNEHQPKLDIADTVKKINPHKNKTIFATFFCKVYL
jgi:hypothetical protein